MWVPQQSASVVYLSRGLRRQHQKRSAFSRDLKWEYRKNGPVQILVLGSNKWVYYDPQGDLGSSGSALRQIRTTGRVAAFGMVIEREASVSPWTDSKYEVLDEGDFHMDVQKMRLIPWQTPHTFDDAGKLRLTETGREWYEKAVKKREKLAVEVRAEA